MKIATKLLATLTICLTLSSCGKLEKIPFRPVVFISDYKNERILHHKLGAVNCSEERFNTFYHVGTEDFNEIVFILKNARMRKSLSKRRDKLIDSIGQDVTLSKHLIE